MAFFLLNIMKSTLLIVCLLLFGFVFGQSPKEYIFKFNVKKWNKEFVKKQKKSQDKVATINLFDVNGKSVLFHLQQRSISEVEVPNVKIFKGKSADDAKLITLTILPKSMSGAYLENGVQYFIEYIKGSCNKYKVYTKPEIDKKIEVGQINDHVK